MSNFQVGAPQFHDVQITLILAILARLNAPARAFAARMIFGFSNRSDVQASWLHQIVNLQVFNDSVTGRMQAMECDMNMVCPNCHGTRFEAIASTSAHPVNRTIGLCIVLLFVCEPCGKWR